MSISEALYRNFSVISLTKYPKLTADIKTRKPSPLIDSLIEAKSMNPVILLDEIDKVPIEEQMALLSILDPMQNKEFKDEVLELNVDLSHIYFVCTANYIEKLS